MYMVLNLYYIERDNRMRIQECRSMPPVRQNQFDGDFQRRMPIIYHVKLNQIGAASFAWNDREWTTVPDPKSRSLCRNWRYVSSRTREKILLNPQESSRFSFRTCQFSVSFSFIFDRLSNVVRAFRTTREASGCGTSGFVSSP